MYPEWKQGSNYQTGDIVTYKGKHYRTKNRLYDVVGEPSDFQPNNSSWEEVMSYPPDLQTEKLLTKVCEMFNDTEDFEIDDVPGLIEWWAKHKSKSEREQKLEKIACALSLEGKSNPDFLKIAERVLAALEQ